MIIYYDKLNQFKLTDEEFKNALPAFESGKNVWVERLKVHLTPYYKWAGIPPENPNIKVIRGERFIRKFGTWVLESNPDLKIDLSYYPELAKDGILETKQKPYEIA